MVAVSFYWWKRKPKYFNNRFNNSQSTCTCISILNLISCCRWRDAESGPTFTIYSQCMGREGSLSSHICYDTARDSAFFCLMRFISSSSHNIFKHCVNYRILTILDWLKIFFFLSLFSIFCVKKSYKLVCLRNWVTNLLTVFKQKIIQNKIKIHNWKKIFNICSLEQRI
jgi:hypothetical protein